LSQEIVKFFRIAQKKQGEEVCMTSRIAWIVLSVTVIGLSWLAVWLGKAIKAAQLRKHMSPETAIASYCGQDYRFDFEKMLRLYHLPVTAGIAKIGYDGYYARIGDGGRIEMKMHLKDDGYYLDEIRQYLDVNWQFTGWYKVYDGRDDGEERKFYVLGCDDAVEAQERRKWPTFMLSKAAIKALLSAIEQQDTK